MEQPTHSDSRDDGVLAAPRAVSRQPLKPQPDSGVFGLGGQPIGRPLAGIAHELTHVLATLMSYATTCRRIAEALPAPSAALLDNLRRAESTAERAGSLACRLRQLTRTGAVRHPLVDLNSLVQRVVSAVPPRVPPTRPPIRLDLDPRLPPVHANPAQIEGAITRVLRAAADASAQRLEESRPRLLVQTARAEPAGARVSIQLLLPCEGAGAAPPLAAGHASGPPAAPVALPNMAAICVGDVVVECTAPRPGP